MSVTKKYSIAAPDDPEIDIQVRDSLDYFVTLPSNYNESKKYGLVFCIAGYGDHAETEYQAEKLRPFITDKYDVITVGVRYQNDLRAADSISYNLGQICGWYGISPEYFKNPHNVSQLLDDLFELIVSRNIFSLDCRMALQVNAFHKYSSFGFMPAIDHLCVLYDVIQKFNIDKQRIIAYGSSYGGYIACLMGKYAPHTFSLVIDNSGYCVAQIDEVLGGQARGTGGSYARYINERRYEIPFTTNTIWSIDENSPYYFSDAHRKIRSLLVEDHRTPSDTVYCCYHSVRDEIAPIHLKDQMYEILKDYNSVFYQRIDEKNIDGRLFKNTGHAMDASLQELFDLSMMKYRESGIIKQDDIDFDQDVDYGFPCLDRIYHFTYTKNGLAVEIEKVF